VDDPLAVGAFEGIGDLDGDRQGLLERQTAAGGRADAAHYPAAAGAAAARAGEARGEGLPLEVLHHEVGEPLVAPHVVQGADVRVGQRRDGAGLALEALTQARVPGDLGGEHLHGDGAVEAPVAGPVDLSHAPGAERRLDLVRP
jgi:hypothetical protein